MASLKKILGLGTVVVDLQMIVDAYPARDSKVEATHSRTQIGGPVPTALTQLAKFGHRCRFHGVWGDDLDGGLIDEDFRRERVEFERHESQSGTGVAHVWVESNSGHRTVVCHRAVPAKGVLCLTAEQMTGFDLLHLDGWPGEAALKSARAMKSVGGLVALDTGSPKSETAALLKIADVINCPLHFVRTFLNNNDPQQAGEQLISNGAKIVTITDGTNGGWIISRDGHWHQPAFAVNAVDTNGAGDVFSAGVIHGVLQNWEPPMILRFASACAAIKCRQVGNRDALPTLSAIDEFLS